MDAEGGRGTGREKEGKRTLKRRSKERGMRKVCLDKWGPSDGGLSRRFSKKVEDETANCEGSCDSYEGDWL